MKRISAVAAVLLMCVMLFGGCREGGYEISGISDVSKRSTEFLEIGDNNIIVAESTYSSSSSVSSISSTLSSKSTFLSISSSRTSGNDIDIQSTSSSTARVSQDSPVPDSPVIIGITDGNSASEDTTKPNSEKPVEITIPQSVSDNVTESVSSSTTSIGGETSEWTSSQ